MHVCAMPVPGFPNYLVTDDGRIYSLNRRRWMKQHIRKIGGYAQVNLWRDGKIFSRRVHVLVLEAFTGPRPEGLQACHGPNGVSDNSLSNLYWDTPANNYGRDKERDGTHSKGSRNPQSKLTEADVIAIRRAYADGETQVSIAARYGLTQGNVGHIVRRDAWKHVA